MPRSLFFSAITFFVSFLSCCCGSAPAHGLSIGWARPHVGLLSKPGKKRLRPDFLSSRTVCSAATCHQRPCAPGMLRAGLETGSAPSVERPCGLTSVRAFGAVLPNLTKRWRKYRWRPSLAWGNLCSARWRQYKKCNTLRVDNWCLYVQYRSMKE